jgi:hypothetical protein
MTHGPWHRKPYDRVLRAVRPNGSSVSHPLEHGDPSVLNQPAIRSLMDVMPNDATWSVEEREGH